MKDSFTVQQDLQWKEFFNVTIIYYLTRKTFRRYFIFLLILSLLSSVLGFVTVPGSFNWFTLLKSILFPLAMLTAVLLFSLIVTVYVYCSRPWLFKNVYYEFTHWGITRNGEQSQFQKPWRDIKSLKETRQFFIFFAGPYDFYIIQKRMFTDATELNAFTSFIKERMF